MRNLPSPALLHRRCGVRRFLLLLVAILATGSCAKFPSSGVPGGNTQVRFRMTVAGRIKPGYIYVVAIRWAKDDPPFDQERGPVPVIVAPWGNGMVAGRANVFMKWDAFQSPDYQAFEFVDPIPDNSFPVDGTQYLIAQPISKGVPLNTADITENSRTLDFTLDMSQIAQNSGDIPLIRNLQINFLTMDRVPQGNDSGSKVWDGLGPNSSPFDAGNFITIPVNQFTTYSNSSGQFANREPTGDTPDPDLDIVDWAVQVIRP